MLSGQRGRHRPWLAKAPMDPAIITALAAVTGSVVGGLTSFATTYFTQRNQAHRDLLSREVAHREELYSQFIKEATNLYADSLDKTLTNPAMLIAMYSLIGRIRLIGSDKVLLAAEKVADSIIVSYSRPPTTFDDIYKVVHETRVDPLKEFTEACREERKATLMHL
jgi:hypothetical protein